jgi:hypothetical protein
MGEGEGVRGSVKLTVRTGAKMWVLVSVRKDKGKGKNDG